jgi:hypothetical protein
MNDKNSYRRRGRRRYPQAGGAERLETRSMLTLATETFTGPSLTNLIQLASEGNNTAPAAIQLMKQALETQLTSGPLADLTSGAVDGKGFVQEVQNLETSYEQNLDQQLSSAFPNIDQILKLAGQAVVADVVSLNQQSSVGLISSSTLATDASTAINSLTHGPIHSLGTPLSGYSSATQSFESDLNTLAQSLSSSATTPLTSAQVSTTVLAEAEAYRATLHAGLQATHPFVSNMVDSAVNALEMTANSVASDTTSTAQTQLNSAISAFDTALLDTTGLFGPQGMISLALANHHNFTPNLTVSQAASSISSVAGTAAAGGTATLTATLTSPATSQGIAGKTISFTLDGAFAGQAVTDSGGVATLPGVVTSDASGTVAGGVVASFAGDINFKSTHATGDLVVS